MLFDGIYSASFLDQKESDANNYYLYIATPSYDCYPGPLEVLGCRPSGPGPGPPGTTAITSVTPHALAPIAQLRRQPRLQVGTVTSEPQSLEIQTA